MDLFLYKLLHSGFDTQTYNWFITKASDYAANKIRHSTSYLDKCNILYTDALLKKCCKNAYQYVFGKKDIAINKFGKPYFRNKRIFFNLSHSGHFGALAISRYPVGVDVEDNVNVIDKRVINMIDKKNKIIEDDYARKVLELWTAKESFLKGLGMGMTYPIDKVKYSEESGRIFVENNINNPWLVSQISTNKYVLTVSYPKTAGIKFHSINRLKGPFN